MAVEQFVTQSAYQSQYRIESLGTWTGKFKISVRVETEQGRRKMKSYVGATTVVQGLNCTMPTKKCSIILLV